MKLTSGHAKICYGTKKENGKPVALRAGDMMLSYCDGTIRNVMDGDKEIVRRMYVAVRDRFWNTIVPEIKNFSIVKRPKSFRIEFDSSHKRNGIHFNWHAIVDGMEDNTISFSMQGQADSSFLYNRIGICVLHPLKECAGKRVVVEKADGTKETLRFPVLAGPWQPMKNIRALFQCFGSVISSELRFFGNVFETEDQRNWTDASFKTYCPPLNSNIPFQINKGDPVSQKVLLRVMTPGHIKRKNPESSVITIDFSKKAFLIPEIGTVITNQTKMPVQKELQLLQACNFSHLRMNVSFDSPQLSSMMKIAAAYSKLLNVPLELALFFRKEKQLFDQDIRILKKMLDEPGLLVKRFLVFRQGEKVASKETLAAVVDALRKYAPQAGIVTGTNGYFVEINRKPPAIKNCDGVCYSANPQVHTFDDASIIDNLEGQAHTVLAGKKLFPGKDIFITPITLRPRPVPELPKKDHGPDPRQKTLFGAAWTLGSIIRLSEAGVSGATYFETTGECGLMEKNGRQAFPMYHVFADVGDFAGGTMRVFQSESRRMLSACVLEKNGRRRYLIANMTQEKRDFFIRDLPKDVLITLLDDTTLPMACLHPDKFRKNTGRKKETKHGRLNIWLGPYAIARIDLDKN
jgi:D-apionolactonase